MRWKFEVVGEDRVPADVSEYCERARCNDRTADSETIESISEVHCICEPTITERDESDERDECKKPQSSDLPSRRE